MQDKLHLSSGEGAKAIDATFGCQTRETGLFHSQAVRVKVRVRVRVRARVRVRVRVRVTVRVGVRARVRVRVRVGVSRYCASKNSSTLTSRLRTV